MDELKIQVLAEAKFEHVTVKLEKHEEPGSDTYFYVRSNENEESYIVRWYAASFWTFAEAMDDFAKIVKDAERGERPWGTGGNLSGIMSNY